MALDRTYWESRYHERDTGWDLGGPSAPLKAYIEQLTDKDLRILIPGAGRAYEAEHLRRLGFRQVFVIDLTDAPYADLLARCPDFPKDHLLVGDLFQHKGQYDRIIEQTCFCAIDPALRAAYVKKMHELLAPGGRLVGVLFDDPHPARGPDGPPFGGSKAEYEALFKPLFPQVSFMPCYNSIPPRAGRELWVCAPR
jgi:SAM-dependent methyltransferase